MPVIEFCRGDDLDNDGTPTYECDKCGRRVRYTSLGGTKWDYSECVCEKLKRFKIEDKRRNKK